VFIGHFALGFAAKRIAPRTSLGTLFAAAEFADILFPILVLLGWESAGFVSGTNPFLALKLDRYPISHGLLALIAWGVVVALLYQWRRDYARGAVVVALLVVSHWVLDFITHRPDMPLWPGGPKVGLELWASVPGTIIVEGLLFAAGVWVYASATRARDAVGRFGLWGLVALLVVLYGLSLLQTGAPSPAAFAAVGMILTAVLLTLGIWVDRHREARAAGAPEG
jgi:LexA-binding, inner membrane-associated putative hydrolase